mgnify:FL=1
MGVVKMRKMGVVLIILALCGIVWLAHPAQQQVKEMEQQISSQYLYANYLLNDTVMDLLAWDFSQPLYEEDKHYINKLFNEIFYLSSIMFSGGTVHKEWRNRIWDLQQYLRNYIDGKILSEEELADLHQALQETRYISMDLYNDIDSNTDLYEAMHDEHHEMVEKVKNRLATQY